MITIKIKDESWFRMNCDLHKKYGVEYLVPSCWTREYQEHTVYFFLDRVSLWPQGGKVLKVEKEDKSAKRMCDSRYMADGHWIPNWAIEWVKEVNEEDAD